MIKKVLFAAALLAVALLLLYSELIAYGIGQARGQLKVLNGAKPIEDLMDDPSFPDSLKSKLQLIEEVRIFCTEDLDMIDSDNYTTFFDQEGKTLLWNLSACEPFALEPYQWSFPMLGSFPYKGFFDLEKAKEEQNELISQGFDTRIRPVGGWSTLGWFSDPILSKMLERSDGRLADLIIHELTHATLFVKDDITFNENLASFIGQRGAQLYLTKKYGSGSTEVTNYLSEHTDLRIFIQHILRSAKLLDQLYGTFTNETDSLKKAQKEFLIDQIIRSLDTVDFHSNRYSHIFDNGRPNNAYFMSFLRYHSVEDSLQLILENEYKSDLKAFIKGMKKYHDN